MEDLTPFNYVVLQRADSTGDDERVEFVRDNFGKHVLSFDDDCKGFTCKCGGHVGLGNNNFRYNVRRHYANPLCKRKLKARPSSITGFFAISRRRTRPEPDVYCVGLWSAVINVDGQQCQTELLGEYADTTLYYTSGRVVRLQSKRSKGVRFAQRTIHSVDCLGHSLDQNDRIRPSRICMKCGSLPHNPSFKKRLLAAQNPARFDTNHRLPSQFYSWKHLQVSVRSVLFNLSYLYCEVFNFILLCRCKSESLVRRNLNCDGCTPTASEPPSGGLQEDLRRLKLQCNSET